MTKGKRWDSDSNRGVRTSWASTTPQSRRNLWHVWNRGWENPQRGLIYCETSGASLPASSLAPNRGRVKIELWADTTCSSRVSLWRSVMDPLRMPPQAAKSIIRDNFWAVYVLSHVKWTTGLDTDVLTGTDVPQASIMLEDIVPPSYSPVHFLRLLKDPNQATAGSTARRHLNFSVDNHNKDITL